MCVWGGNRNYFKTSSNCKQSWGHFRGFKVCKHFCRIYLTTFKIKKIKCLYLRSVPGLLNMFTCPLQKKKCISNQIKRRCYFSIHHSAVLLFDPSKFKELTKGFPAKLLEETVQVNTIFSDIQMEKLPKDESCHLFVAVYQ